jgi:manganese/zinc/iron transport system substrate-binding protein
MLQVNSPMFRRVLLLLVVPWCLLSVGCPSTSGPGPIGTGPVRVVATTSIIADAVKQVGGKHVEVLTLMPPGTDPHNYLPASSDSQTLASAHLILSNGLHLEGKMGTLLEQPMPGQRSAVVTSHLDHKTQVRKVDGEGEDPHIWFDVKLWMLCVEAIREELVTLDPAHAESYRTNAAKHLAELQSLDAEVRAKADRLPKAKRVLVTSHDAFGYFGAAYGFEVHGLQGVSTAATTSTKDVENLAETIGRGQVRAIFCETSVRTKGLEKVLDTVKTKYPNLGEVRLVAGDDALYSDSLGVAGTPGESYIGMVRHNIDTIVKFLQP